MTHFIGLIRDVTHEAGVDRLTGHEPVGGEGWDARRFLTMLDAGRA